jgi:NADPH:quinone reductase-like Zn-dependent oxidoreductase
VVEVGGEKTIEQSLGCIRVGGAITVIGAVSGMGGGIAPRSLITTGARLLGIYVGSRAMHEDLARCVAVNGIRPVIDRVFEFDDAPAAFRHFDSGRHFGKVAIGLGG